MTKTIYVLDTSVYLTNADSIFSFNDNDIIIPLKVLEEVDKHKKRQDGAGLNARTIIRILDSLREEGSLYEGVGLGPGLGKIKVRGIETVHTDQFPKDLNMNVPDHMIIATALSEKIDSPESEIVVVTRDINMRVICDSLGLSCEDYIDNKIVKSGESIFTGHVAHSIEDSEIDALYSGEEIYLDPEEIEVFPNQFVMLKSNINSKRTVLTRFVNYVSPLVRVAANRAGVWGVKPRNREQTYALDILMNPDISLVTLIGKAGSGKTLCAIAAGIQQTLDPTSGDAGEPRYTRMIVSRPVQPLGKDIGFLPGTLEEKMHPWLMPIQDNLQFLMGNDKATLEMYMEQGTIEIEALTYIRGRSIANAFIIIDEAQNLTTHELKTIITRVGEGTKIVLTGDVEQIDNTYIDATSNGLTHAVEKFKEADLAAHITLLKGERSKVATLAAKIL